MPVLPDGKTAWAEKAERGVALRTLWLDALPGEKLFDRSAVHPENAADPDRVETTVVDQAADRLGMNPEPVRDLLDAI